MDRHLGDLVTFIDPSHGLIDAMYAADCLTSRQRIHSVGNSTINEQYATDQDNQTRQCFRFRQIPSICLDKAEQQLIVRILTEDGTMAHTAARLHEGTDTKKNEAKLVECFLSLISSTPSESREQYMAIE